MIKKILVYGFKLLEMKNLNRKEYLNKSGIYIIESTFDHRCYVGSSKQLYKRINKHIKDLRNNKHHASKLQRFFNKYGEECLNIRIIKLCDEKDLIKEENFFKKLYDSYTCGFDSAKIAKSGYGVIWTIEEKEKQQVNLFGNLKIEILNKDNPGVWIKIK